MRFATIGSNFVVDHFLSAAKACDGFELAGVYSRTEARAHTYAAHHGIERIYTSMDALCGDPQIDAVYVASPNICHAAQIHALLCAGKHVLCEKPIVLQAATFATLIDTAAAHHVFLMEAMRPAHSPGIFLLQNACAQIGPIRRATLSFCKYSSRYDAFRHGITENAFNPALGNGALMDIGIYCVHVMQLLFGLPKRIQGSAIFLRGNVDGAGSLLCDYDEMICEILYSKIANDVLPSQIQGEDGSLVFDALSVMESIRIQPRKGDIEIRRVSLASDDMCYEIQDFLALAQAKADVRRALSTHNTLCSMRILDDARTALGIVYPQENLRL